MSKGRLTRQELGWLLTQEAQGAAERLRVGVQVLKTNPPPADPEGGGVDATLDALDDAMRMLSTLHNKPLRVGGRRGRVDLAALLWEIAPEARVSIEPGSGTEVFGDEAELRRMLQLLVGHGSGTESQLSIKRDEDIVKVSVVLGPDSSATAAAERAWVSRMAIRYGGRLDLEGGMEIVSLPADSERKERENLQKELDEARKQGEAYARELAQALSPSDEPAHPSTFPPPLASTDTVERVAVLVRLLGGVAAELRSLLVPVAREVAAVAKARTEPDGRLETARKGLSQTQEFVNLLGAIGSLDPQELPGPVDLVEIVSRWVGDLSARAERAGVTLRFEEAGRDPIYARGAPRATSTLVQQLIGQAIAASPRGSEVVLRVLGGESGPKLVIDDAGPTLPATARRDFVALELEPGTYGRPTSIPLYVAAALASWQGATFEVTDAPGGGLRASVTFTR